MRTRSRTTPGEDSNYRLSWFSVYPTETMYDDTSYPYVNKECTHTVYKRIGGNGRFGWYVGGGYPFVGYSGPTAVAEANGSGRCNVNFPSLVDAESEVVASLNATYSTQLREAGRSDFHFISFMREIEQTVAMLKSPIRALKHCTKVAQAVGLSKKTPIVEVIDCIASKRSAKGFPTSTVYASRLTPPLRKKIVTKSKAIDTATDAWLQGTYGWQPFLYDMIAITGGVEEAMADRKALLSRPETPFSYRAKSSANSVTSPIPGNWFTSYGERLVACTGTYSGTWRPNPSLQNESMMACLARATNIDRLGYAAWDAVPYSFVVDWFLPNVGARLDDAISGPQFFLLGSLPWLSIKSVQTLVITVSPGNETGWGTGSETNVQNYFNRRPAVLGDIDVTDHHQGMQGTRIASGLCLAIGAIRRR